MIFYNSFNRDCRDAVGAIVAGTTLTLRIQVTDVAVQNVAVEIFPDGQQAEDSQRVHMQAEGQGWYTGHLTPPSAGLYFYRFVIATDPGGQVIYYAPKSKTFGGTGVAGRDGNTNFYQLTVLAKEETLPDWYKNAIFYHIFVDRFNNGNADGHVNHPKPNSFLYGTHQDLPYYVKDANGEIVRWDFYGGNLLGIEQKLPYLKQLGVTALFLSPIFAARSNHRYDTADYEQIDSMLGSLADFDHFLTAVHSAGMHVILDGVFNHVGADSRYFDLYHTYEPRNGAADSQESPYYDWFTFTQYPSKYDAWWGVSDLPAINKDSASFHHYIAGTDNGIIDRWTKRGVDGWRLDVADELRDSFIAQIRQAVDQYPDRVLIGEVWEDASNKVAYGQRHHYLEGGMLQAVMNYPLRNLLVELLNGKASVDDFVQYSLTIQEHYPRTVFQNNFNNIGTHDTERILTAMGGDVRKLALLLNIFLATPGVPCIYYGDEVGVTGGKDPDNRRFFPWGHENTDVQGIFTTALQRRRTDPALANTASFIPFYGYRWGGIWRHLPAAGDRPAQDAILVFNPNEIQILADIRQLHTDDLTVDQAAFLRQHVATVPIPAYGYQWLPGQTDMV
ncbi:glycoside hydrolase family 13 protein [Schleiferilactobacillus shenzhenensis]|uniref:Alpha-amylase n=1 Tax=Schleiferilactobacillus shenzhenensis LY-73 TaxID=1231336 RepID=U4TRR4_9LACO|nr:glycoside hydrolase family 13 protein [Schleiferilactobacillus shenzhenensis]ERL64593.1 alpha-amylase [Schleiferilactobacillus shenzhenensis LY-73]